MEENNSALGGIILGIIIGVILWSLFSGGGKYEGQTAEEWFNEYDEQVSLNEDYKSALEQANYNIIEANDMIDSAKYYTWESYEDMGYALESLETVYTVDEPY